MNKNEMITALTAKANELMDSIKAMENNPKLSECTVRTQRYQRTHEVHNLLIIRTLLEGKELTGDLEKWLVSAATLTATRRGPSIIFHDGDDLFTIQEANPNKSYADLKKIMADQGFHLEGHTVKAN